MNAPPEEIAKWEEARTPPPIEFEIHEDNWDVFLLFSKNLSSQWELDAGMGGIVYVGIPLPRIESLLNIKSIPQQDREAMLEEIQLMERSALAVFNKTEG